MDFFGLLSLLNLHQNLIEKTRNLSRKHRNIFWEKINKDTVKIL